MDKLKQEKENLFRLIETWNGENIELALQLMEGNESLRVVAETLYLPILQHILGENNLEALKQIRPYIFIELYEDSWEASPEQLGVLKTIPIEELDCSELEMHQIPEWICAMTQLKYLILKGNEITEIPDAIGQLINLKELNLNQNNIKVLPSSIGSLIKLHKLQLDFNQIEKIPDSIGNLSSLKWLSLGNNQISSLPDTIRNLKEIEWFSIENTPLGTKHGLTNGAFIDIDEICALL